MTLASQYRQSHRYVYDHTAEDGTTVYRMRTPRGAEQHTWNWMKRHPHLFTSVAIRMAKHRRGLRHNSCPWCLDPAALVAYAKWIRSATYARLWQQGR